jgi:hypothetical protein
MKYEDFQIARWQVVIQREAVNMDGNDQPSEDAARTDIYDMVDKWAELIKREVDRAEWDNVVTHLVYQLDRDDTESDHMIDRIVVMLCHRLDEGQNR